MDDASPCAPDKRDEKRSHGRRQFVSRAQGRLSGSMPSCGVSKGLNWASSSCRCLSIFTPRQLALWRQTIHATARIGPAHHQSPGRIAGGKLARRLLTVLVVCALGLLGMSLMLQSPGEAGKSLLAAAAGVVAAWLLVARSRGWKSRLAYGWLITASFLALIPGMDTRVSLLALPPALWLLARGASCTTHSHRLPFLLVGLWMISVLTAVGQSSWMLVFVGAAFTMLRLGGRSREGWVLALAAMFVMVVISGIRAAQLGRGIMELWKPAACGRPIAWIMVSEAGWFGHGVAPCAVLAAAPSLCTEWGWIGLGMASILIAGMIACSLVLVVFLANPIRRRPCPGRRLRRSGRNPRRASCRSAHWPAGSPADTARNRPGPGNFRRGLCHHHAVFCVINQQGFRFCGGGALVCPVAPSGVLNKPSRPRARFNHPRGRRAGQSGTQERTPMRRTAR